MDNLRRVLEDSHVAAVAIAVLLLWSLDVGFRCVWDPVYRLGAFVATAIAIRDIPYFSRTLNSADRLMLITSLFFLYGAIALGWALAQGLLHFAYAFSAPIAGWLARREYRGMTGGSGVTTNFSLQDAIPELIKSFSLLLVTYVLLRWLYYEPSASERTEPGSEPNT